MKSLNVLNTYIFRIGGAVTCTLFLVLTLAFFGCTSTSPTLVTASPDKFQTLQSNTGWLLTIQAIRRSQTAIPQITPSGPLIQPKTQSEAKQIYENIKALGGFKFTGPADYLGDIPFTLEVETDTFYRGNISNYEDVNEAYAQFLAVSQGLTSGNSIMLGDNAVVSPQNSRTDYIAVLRYRNIVVTLAMPNNRKAVLSQEQIKSILQELLSKIDS